jgi:hypothetical protein
MKIKLFENIEEPIEKPNLKTFNLKEGGNFLNEKEESLKKKIFNLKQMERLKDNDQMLTNKYQEMAKDGAETYGYHYNETILNILFNNYVLNDPKYLIKYKRTPRPEKNDSNNKKREKIFRDMHHKQIASDKEELKKQEEEPLQTDIEETTTASSSGSYSTPYAWAKNPKSARYAKKSMYAGGTVVESIKKSNDYLTNPKYFEEYAKLISESITETHLNSKEEKVAYIIEKKPNDFKIEDLDKMQDTEIDSIYGSLEKLNGMNENDGAKNSKTVEKKIGAEFEEPDGYAKITNINPDGSFDAEVNNVKHKFTRSYEADGSFMETGKHDIKEMNKLSEDFVGFFTDKLKKSGKTLKSMTPDEKRAFFLAVDKEYKAKDEKVQEMIGANEPSESPLVNKSSEVQTDPSNLGGGGGMNEDRKLPNIAMVNRLQAQNKKNFDSDLKNNSPISDLVKKAIKDEDKANKYIPATDAMSYEDIEKEQMKKTKGVAFKNVGNSANLKGDEIPKRNETEKEKEEIMLNRGAGMEDLRYGNEVGERFEERMKKDMGYKYDERLKKQEYRKKMVSYNKDPQPIEQDKPYKKNMESIDETKMTGYFMDDLNKKVFTSFNLSEVKEIKSTDTLKKLTVEGLGNGYGARLEVINENVVNTVKANDFYINEKSEVFIKRKEKTNVNESVGMNKFKHLLGYNPNEFVDAKKSI